MSPSIIERVALIRSPMLWARVFVLNRPRNHDRLSEFSDVLEIKHLSSVDFLASCQKSDVQNCVDTHLETFAQEKRKYAGDNKDRSVFKGRIYVACGEAMIYQQGLSRRTFFRAVQFLITITSSIRLVYSALKASVIAS